MRSIARSTLPLLLLAGIFVLLPTAIAAQDDNQNQADPPSRVGRLNYTEGSVSYQVQGDTDWVQADPNRPLTTGDNLWVDKDSRGEVHIDSTAVRLSSETGLSILNLDDRTVQLELPQGTIEVHLRQLAPGDAFEIDTPNLSFTPTRAGEYVISTDPNGTYTSVVVREGDGEVIGGGDSWALRDGQRYTFTGSDLLAYHAEAAPDFDDFEAWSQTRDEAENNSVSAKYVSRDVDGYYDLDQYGDWSEDADYGSVWYPRAVAVDWVPYHMGHWVYIAPWGWTWVDEEPWGFAPFHYGRWVLVGARWGWVPGPRVVRPVYAPALVGFVGGAHIGVSIAIGGGFTGVAWFPLGPRDVFVPAYHCSPHYVTVVNVTNTRVVDVTRVTTVYNTVVVRRDVTHVDYTYGRNVRAVTAVSRDTFVGARPVAREAVRINDTDMHNVRVVSNTVIAPTRTSYIAADARVATARPAFDYARRPVVTNLPPRVPVQTRRPDQRGDQRGDQNGGGFRSFGGNNGNRNAQPTNDNARFGTHTPPRSGEAMQPPPQSSAPAINSTHTQPRSGETMQQPPANSQSNGGNNNGNNGGFHRFTPPNGGGANGNAPNNSAPQQPSRGVGSSPNNGGTQGGNNQPLTQEGNDRFRYSPPVRARDENYDVHPPLNQNQNRSQNENRPQGQSAQPHEEHHEAPHGNSNNQSNQSNQSRDGGGGRNH